MGLVLSRALGAFAAHREITVDRLSDAMLLSDAISAGALASFADGHVSLSIADRDEGLEVRVEQDDDGEFLVVGIAALAA